MIGENVKQVRNNEYPYIVSIVKISTVPTESIVHICTGTLIAKRDVITIGHCLINQHIWSIRVMVGSIHLDAGLKFYPLWWKMYNEWAEKNNFSHKNLIDDIAVMRLSEKIPANIKPVGLLTLSKSNLFGLNVTTAGWGLSNTGSLNNVMEKVTLKILTDNEVNDRVLDVLGHELFVDPEIICSASEPFALLQFGDSGGPLLYNDMIIGVNIGTAPLPTQPTHPKKINIHFNINHYRIFILHVMNTRNN
ncbi:PREDICTED: trypsin iota-like [Ceratosolen solmsi marchali]|uniref:Trypsin iota-like n=1 Tax=Ceratosolen solmsi marchali TaxID=326594 RepID=A0AAJ6YNV4_9HYME|nr:PREDICTED: trypsin iota-like [Ceratosolen solmsi marchali]